MITRAQVSYVPCPLVKTRLANVPTIHIKYDKKDPEPIKPSHENDFDPNHFYYVCYFKCYPTNGQMCNRQDCSHYLELCRAKIHHLAENEQKLSDKTAAAGRPRFPNPRFIYSSDSDHSPTNGSAVLQQIVKVKLEKEADVSASEKKAGMKYLEQYKNNANASRASSLRQQSSSVIPVFEDYDSQKNSLLSSPSNIDNSQIENWVGHTDQPKSENRSNVISPNHEDPAEVKGLGSLEKSLQLPIQSIVDGTMKSPSSSVTGHVKTESNDKLKTSTSRGKLADIKNTLNSSKRRIPPESSRPKKRRTMGPSKNELYARIHRQEQDFQKMMKLIQEMKANQADTGAANKVVTRADINGTHPSHAESLELSDAPESLSHDAQSSSNNDASIIPEKHVLRGAPQGYQASSTNRSTPSRPHPVQGPIDQHDLQGQPTEAGRTNANASTTNTVTHPESCQGVIGPYAIDIDATDSTAMRDLLMSDRMRKDIEGYKALPLDENGKPTKKRPVKRRLSMAVCSTQHYKNRQCPGYADAQLRYKILPDGMMYLGENIKICSGYWDGPPNLLSHTKFYREVLSLLFSDYHLANSSFEPEDIKKERYIPGRSPPKQLDYELYRLSLSILDDYLVKKKVTPKSRLKLLTKASTTCSNRMRDLRTEHLEEAKTARRRLQFGDAQPPSGGDEDITDDITHDSASE